jgi:hypothetical protein
MTLLGNRKSQKREKIKKDSADDEYLASTSTALTPYQ